jgi:hypothetical protein
MAVIKVSTERTTSWPREVPKSLILRLWARGSYAGVIFADRYVRVRIVR